MPPYDNDQPKKLLVHGFSVMSFISVFVLQPTPYVCVMAPYNFCISCDSSVISQHVKEVYQPNT